MIALYIMGMCINSRGEILILNRENEKIYVLNGEEGTLLKTFKISCAPRSICVDSEDNIYIAIEDEGVDILSSDGNLIQRLLVDEPDKVDVSGRTLIVSSSRSDMVFVYSN